MPNQDEGGGRPGRPNDRRQRQRTPTPSRVDLGGPLSFVWPDNTGSLRDIFEDSRLFQSTANRRWYMKRGIPYRRGYFLQGPPKCGKTHLVKLLTRHLGSELHIIDLTNPTLTDNTLIEIFTKIIAPHSIVLFKGIERAVQYRTSERSHGLCLRMFRRRTGDQTVVVCSAQPETDLHYSP